MKFLNHPLFFLFTLIHLASGNPGSNTVSVGVDIDRLQRMHEVVSRAVEEKPLTGAVTLVARRGEIVDVNVIGDRDIIKDLPMQRDSIFSIYSMTKTITSAAVMILVEEGKLALDEPVEKYLPELKDRQVCTGADSDGLIIAPAKNKILIRDLLTHTNGYPYPGRAPRELREVYRSSRAMDKDVAGDMDLFLERLSKLPLSREPGTQFQYGVGLDIAGALIERVSGKSFGEFLKERFFDPMGMIDTSFSVPPEKRHRIVPVFRSEDGRPAYQHEPSEHGQRLYGIEAGGAGLYSTIDDYFKFAQMLLNKGQWNGKTIIGKRTVEIMMQNQLGFLPKARHQWNRSEGFGYGGSVKTDDFYHGHLSSIGTFGWSGAATTYFRIDPEEEMIALFFTSHMPQANEYFKPFVNTTWQAIVE